MITFGLQNLTEILKTHKKQIDGITTFHDLINLKFDDNPAYKQLAPSNKVAILENLACMYAILKNGKISVIIRTYTSSQIKLKVDGDEMTIGYFKLPDRLDFTESMQMIREYLTESRQLLGGLINKLPISFEVRNA